VADVLIGSVVSAEREAFRSTKDKKSMEEDG
jgi:hypothetical protein